MFNFVIPLLLGFTFNLLSALTATFSHRWGERNGTFITLILRAVLGIPLWTVGLGLAISTPSPTMSAPTIVMGLIGISSLAVGCIIIYSAFLTMRAQALMPSARDALVQNGIYAHMRHPMDAGSMLSFIGLLLLRPTQTVVIACILGMVWTLLQAWVEELDLLRRIPAYRAYMNRVPRFVPYFRMK